MSYILEALRKAEQERKLGQAPDWQSIALPLPSPRPRPWTWLLVVALLANAAAVTALFAPAWRDRALMNVPMNSASLAPESSIAKDSRGPETASTEASAVPAKRNSGSLEPTPAQTVESAGTLTVKESGPPPPLRALPADFQRSVPALNLDVHVYSEHPAERFVLINSRRYREGERLREGPLLEGIVLDGIVLTYQNRRFRLLVHQ